MLPKIYSWLSTSDVEAIVGSPPRVYRHGEAPQGVARPYVTWQLVSGSPDNTLSELPLVDRIVVQVDCWHPDDAGVEALATAVRDALELHGHMTAVLLDQREPDTKLYRIAMQFDVWLSREG